MKKFPYQKMFLQKAGTFLFLAMVGFVTVDCSDKCEVKRSYTYYEPVYQTTAEIKAATAVESARSIGQPGKIYFKDHTLFVNEVGKGIHVIDNLDPTNPKLLAFINIPGNYDLAILGNTLYADSFIDLVLFDVSNIGDIKEVSRLENFFKNYTSYGFSVDVQQGVVTSWEKVGKVDVSENDCSFSQMQQVNTWGGIFYDKGIAFNYSGPTAQTLAAISPSQTGIGGSMARFTIAKNYLYALDGSSLAIADVTNQTQPVRKDDITLGWWPETLFPTDKNLFVGTRAGMYIYDLTTPAAPSLVSQYEHISSCDPVVVEGDYAYVTLYDGDICHMGTNELQVIDISDLKNPSLVKKYQMTNPHGLGIDNSTLFICDGSDGLKIYDATDVTTIDTHAIIKYSGMDALDVIPYNKIAMMIGKSGIYQYDYSDVKNIKFLSKIDIAPSN
jgi:hypothetical protein